jgi:hypothetical protein
LIRNVASHKILAAAPTYQFPPITQSQTTQFIIDLQALIVPFRLHPSKDTTNPFDQLALFSIFGDDEYRYAMISFIVHMTRNIPNDLSKTLHSFVNGGVEGLWEYDM